MVNIPDDLIENILTRVPAKSLAKFKLVSKAWYDLISSTPRFAVLQSKREEKQTKLLISTDRGLYSVDHEALFESDDDFDDHSGMQLLLSERVCVSEGKLIGSCAGLVCLDYNKHKSLVIWNPSIAVYKCVPYGCYMPKGLDSSGGFGYDSLSDDFKVVLHFYTANHNLRELFVFSLRKNSWTTPRSLLGSHKRLRSNFKLAAHVNYALHWLACSRTFHADHITNTYSVVAFDLQKETLHDIALPNVLANLKPHKNTELGELGGCLCMCFAESVMDSKIWVMKEYGILESWTVLFNISLSCSRLIYGHQFLPLCASSDGGVIAMLRGILVSYNGKKDEKPRLLYKVRDFLGHACANTAAIYSETLISPRRCFVRR